MFTVKQVYPDSSEKFWETSCIHVSQGSKAPDFGTHLFFQAAPNGLHIYLEHGDIYVMNDNGRTVQQYHLGDGKTGKVAVDNLVPVVGTDQSIEVRGKAAA